MKLNLKCFLFFSILIMPYHLITYELRHRMRASKLISLGHTRNDFTPQQAQSPIRQPLWHHLALGSFSQTIEVYKTIRPLYANRCA
jgi:hypothetical protein